MLRTKLFVSLLSCGLVAAPSIAAAQSAGSPWSFAVSGDSRNCGDFVMPAIAARVKAEKDAFYWHLGDFRWTSQPDQDLVAMQPAGKELSRDEYHQREWDDFLTHQIASFGSFPVFLGRGNHEAVPPMTREGYIEKFSTLLDRPEITAQRKADGADAAPLGPWYHWIQNGVDFITLDNSTRDEFTDAQLHWLRAVLDHDLVANSGVTSIVAGAHEALPHSTGAEHAMDDWDRGDQTGELVYHWFYDAQAAGKHVYLIASHSHYYSPDIYDTPYWKQHTPRVVPGLIIGSAGAHRYALPKTAHKGAKTMIYGYVQGTVAPDGTIDFQLKELTEQEMMNAKWPNAPEAAIHECYVHNGDAK
ncbi:MAG TPA: hypothetical protein VG225_00950 [Terracidiphilus sp.]|nr:hypothetical protein [Terracidiphilus sp.]